ncbi:efflux RND transporter periplasmic adaptor subunit [Hyalangium sp.]|uniref:efflux RND transporter periplasmic adaptor subunit n=1 Tax=Hyalangium sp. TaxID=2028555 RepID=UPI002D341226|nr:efflux RND transporter periplasmic adaptor subunit [Hyalangium sp.]HYI01794.1 efflux RND transporter periplasmic adaptor subunit [Hyalangium sp.]
MTCENILLPHAERSRAAAKPLVFALLLVTASCSQTPAAEAPGGAPPPASVSVVTIEQQPIEEASDYLATLTSRRAVVLHPQVSGYVRSIATKPGTPVKAGALLLQIDSEAETASLQNLIATRDSLVASAAFAKDQHERTQTLQREGIVSQQDASQARSQTEQAEASLRAADALIASQKARLSFFNIVAPIDGVVGNVPVKVGDFVTPATPLTSVTQDSGLEAEVQVPVERAAALGPNSKVRLLRQDGTTLAESPVVFISPSTDPGTQLVLIKAAFDSLQGLRADQMVRARVVFSTAPGLAIPTRAITRQAGQTFAFVVDPNNVARRLSVTLGAIQGNSYVVKAGLDSGQKVVVSGLQMLADGAPVQLTEQRQD